MNNISVILVSFNAGRYLETAVRSVLEQSRALELIVVDGSSTDGSVDLLRSFKRQYPDRFHYISEPDRGPGDAWNKGLKMARGEILGWLGADDVYKPDVLSEVVDYFDRHPDVDFVYGGVDMIDAQGRFLKTIRPADFTVRQLIHYRQALITPATFYRKAVFDGVGPFDDMGNDVDFFIKVAKNFKMAKIETIICDFRIHPASQTKGNDVKRRRWWLRQWCLTSRRHGGHCLSGYCIRYYIFAVCSPLLSVWNHAFMAWARFAGRSQR